MDMRHWTTEEESNYVILLPLQSIQGKPRWTFTSKCVSNQEVETSHHRRIRSFLPSFTHPLIDWLCKWADWTLCAEACGNNRVTWPSAPPGMDWLTQLQIKTPTCYLRQGGAALLICWFLCNFMLSLWSRSTRCSSHHGNPNIGHNNISMFNNNKKSVCVESTTKQNYAMSHQVGSRSDPESIYTSLTWQNHYTTFCADWRRSMYDQVCFRLYCTYPSSYSI